MIPAFVPTPAPGVYFGGCAHADTDWGRVQLQKNRESIMRLSLRRDPASAAPGGVDSGGGT